VQGVRRLGAASVDMCHVALGIVEAYWEFRLKPWDMAAGVLVYSFFCFLPP
jgi:myo-inositol-1(or 4)-monophosphatase